jgi:hypothetical protein
MTTQVKESHHHIFAFRFIENQFLIATNINFLKFLTLLVLYIILKLLF